MGFCSRRPFLLAAILLLSQAPRGQGAPDQEKTPPAGGAPARTDPYGDPLPVGALQRLGTLRFRLENYGTLHFLFPDGNTLALSTGRHVRLLDVATGKVIRTFDEHAAHLSSLALSPDGKQMVGCGNDATVRLWDVDSGKVVRRFVSQARNVRSVRISPDGKTLASGGWDKAIVLWDVATGKELRRFTVSDRDTGMVFALDFSPDGKTLAAAVDASAVKLGNDWSMYKVCLLDVVTGKELHATRVHVPVFQVGFAPDGQTLMAVEPTNGGKPDSTIHLWDLPAWKHRPLPNQPERVGTAVFSPDSKMLASGSDRKTCLWDVASGKLLPAFQGKHLPASSLVFAPDGKTLITSNGSTLRFWDAATGQERTAVQAGHQDGVDALMFQPDGKTLATVGRDQMLRLWDLTSGKEVRPANALGSADYPQHCFAPDGKTLAWRGGKQTVHLWDVAAGKEAQRLPLAATCFAFAADGRTLAIGGKLDQPIWLWDLAAGKGRRSLAVPRYYDYALAFPPNGKYLLAYGEDEGANGDMRLRLFHVSRGRELCQWGDGEKYPGFGFSPDSRLLALAGKSGTLEMWELATRKKRYHFEVPKGIRVLAFSRDGGLLALGTLDWQVHVLDVVTGREVACFQGHRGAITALGFSLDDKTLASAGYDTSVLLWDVAPLQRKPGAPVTPLTAQELDALWDDLAADGGSRVHQAIGRLAGVPRQTELLVKERLKLPQPIGPERLERLIADLDSDRFAVRDKASEELEKLADLVAPALEKALEGKLSLETRQRMETILGKLSAEAVPARESLRGLRAIEVLERIGSLEARRQLEALAGAKPPTRVTQEAAATLQRLDTRPSRP